jgi:RNA polymerase sigma-70 factor (ECF subfamily)
MAPPEKIPNHDPSDTDESLMSRFQSGDEEAFQILFARYAARLVNFAYRSLGARQEAEDVAQETLVRVHRARERFDPSRPFRPWVFSIAARLASNRRRDIRRRGEEPLLDDAGGPAPSLEPSDAAPLPLEQAEKDHLAREVRKALDGLPENQRTAVLLARFDDMTYEETAQTMGLSVTAVRSLLFRARQTLKNSLSPLAQEP